LRRGQPHSPHPAMGKKGKKGKKKGKGGDGPEQEVIPVEFLELTRKQLEEKIETFEYRLHKAAKDRNYMQLEKDMVNRFYDITRREVKQLEAELLNKDRQMETMEKDHRVNIKVYEQKVQNLEYEHKNNRSEVQDEGERAIQDELSQHSKHVSKMQSEKKDIQAQLRETQLANEDDVRSRMRNFKTALERLRNEGPDSFEARHKQLEKQYEDQVEQLKADLELQRKVEIHEIEERKNQHINELLSNHQDSFDHIKRYYNDITHDNLKLIGSLKEEIAEMRAKEKANVKKMNDLQKQNKELTAPLADKEKLRADLQEQLKSYNKDKMALRNLRARSVQVEERAKEARAEYRAMEDKFRRIEKERDDLQRKFNKGVREIRRRAEFKNLVLEKKLEILTNAYNEKQKNLSDVLQAAKLDPQVVTDVAAKLEQVLGSKNRLIRELQYQVHQATKSYNDTIAVYESKLAALGIPPEEIGFEKIHTATSTMPARLVTKAP